jgi:hypothetical protein
MAILPNNGTCSYNGAAFTALYSSRASAKPVRDEANRTTAYVQYTLSVEGYIAGNTGGNDATLAQMRKNLSAQGGALVYQNKGFGDLIVNAPGLSPVKDVAFGPIPEILEWKPLGDVNAALVKWQVTTRIPECDSAIYEKGLLALNYRIDTKIDDDGYTTLRTSGYLEIPMTRNSQADRTLPDTADKYRDLCVPAVPLGFRRTQDYSLSLDKRRLDFDITDQEVPAALPENATKIDARQEVEGKFSTGGFRMWTVSFEATITLQRTVPKTQALSIFLLIVSQRMRSQNGRITLPIGGDGYALIPQRLRFGDEMFGRTSQFGMSFLAGGFDLKSILEASSMWIPVSGTDYNSWRSSMTGAGGAWSDRGTAQIAASSTDDRIIDLCDNGDINSLTPTAPPDDTGGIEDAQLTKIIGDVTPENSWIDYQVETVYLERSHVVRHKPLLRQATLQAVPPAEGNDTDVTSTLRTVGAPGAKPGFLSLPPDNFQRVVQPSRQIALVGQAARVGYRIEPPELKSVGGQPVVEVARKLVEGSLGSYSTVPINTLQWAIVYEIPGAFDGGLPVPPNPVLETAGDDGGDTTLRTVPSEDNNFRVR